MDRTERFYRLELLIKRQAGVTFDQLLDELEVSPATLKRDLQYLRDRMDAPIVYDRADNVYRFADGAPGEIGIIAPVTEAFCGACSRIRLTADGQIRTCLFSTVEHSLRDVVRDGASRAEIIEFVRTVVMKKEPRHYINDPSFVAPSRSMSFIGG